MFKTTLFATCPWQSCRTLTPKRTTKEPESHWKVAKFNIQGGDHNVTIDAKHGSWTSQRAVRQRDTQQKGSLQLGFVWGINVTQFSCCNVSNGFSGSDYSGDVPTFHSGWPWQKRDDVKPSCPHTKTGVVYPLWGGRKPGWRMTSVLRKHWMCPCHFKWNGWNGWFPSMWATYIKCRM